jgi:hypothetical protein
VTTAPEPPAIPSSPAGYLAAIVVCCAVGAILVRRFGERLPLPDYLSTQEDEESAEEDEDVQ